MSKAKILADRVSITSDVLTDENLERIETLAPSVLSLVDENSDEILYRVASDATSNSFTKYGATFKGGISLGAISKEILDLDKDTKERKIKDSLAGILTKINLIEDQVTEYLENAVDLSDDIEFIG